MKVLDSESCTSLNWTGTPPRKSSSCKAKMAAAPLSSREQSFPVDGTPDMVSVARGLYAIITLRSCLRSQCLSVQAELTASCRLRPQQTSESVSNKESCRPQQQQKPPVIIIRWQRILLQKPSITWLEEATLLTFPRCAWTSDWRWRRRRLKVFFHRKNFEACRLLWLAMVFQKWVMRQFHWCVMCFVMQLQFSVALGLV